MTGDVLQVEDVSVPPEVSVQHVRDGDLPGGPIDDEALDEVGRRPVQEVVGHLGQTQQERHGVDYGHMRHHFWVTCDDPT